MAERSTPAAANGVSGIIEWLCGDACHGLDDAGLVAGLGERLRAAGLRIDWLSVHLRTLHPEIAGRMRAWTPDGRVEVQDREFGFAQYSALAGSPIRQVMDTGEWREVRADSPEGRRWLPLFEVFERAGIAALVIAPLAFCDGPVSAAAFGSRRREGFSAAEHAILERVVPALRGACELRILRQIEATLLDTYVGATTGRRVLAGHIRRGEVETLEAALLLCDLRGFTALSNRLPDHRVLELLNRYFDEVVPAITAGGGEVLKFIGDAVLAFFHREGGPAESCAAALAAARAALGRVALIQEPDAALEAGIALHHGVVSYGNIGSGRRLDFTLIGRDVNLVSRIETVCAATGQALLMSERFVRLAGLPDAVSVGRHALKGFAEPIELFAATLA